MANVEVGYTVFLGEEDGKRLFAFLKQSGYTPNLDGLEKFLKEVSSGKTAAGGVAGATANAIRKALTSPEVLKAAQTYGPLAARLVAGHLFRGR